MSTFYRSPVLALFFAVLFASTSAIAQPRPIRSGDIVEGALVAGDEVLAQDGSFYDLYLYSGSPGEEIVITLRSSDFDAFLIGGPTEADAFNMFENDDDSAGGTDAELTTSANTSGQYYFLVNTLAAGERGAYQVDVSSTWIPTTPPLRPQTPSVQPRLIRSGDTVEGMLVASDEVLAQDGSFYDLYLYSGSPGEEIVITLRSSDFDAFLIGGPTEADAFNRFEDNDDGAEGTNAELTASANASGQYYFLVNTFAAGESGAYQVGVSSAGGGTFVPPTPPAPPPEPSTVISATGGSHAMAYRGRNGERLTFQCPAGTPSTAVWGTGLYTDDSRICAAGIHAGVITAASGGLVTIEIRPGASAYTGSTHHGVRSSNFRSWAGSYVVVDGNTSASSTPPSQPPATTPAIDATWGSHATSYRGRNGERFTFRCPPGTPSGTVWGTGLYTDDSRICKAGVHAGVITAASGGLVTIEIRPGASAYTASTRHGITTSRYGRWHGSYVVIGGTSASSTPPGPPSAQPRLITVEIDCYHSSLSSTSTGNPVWVEFWSGDRRVGRETSNGIRCTASGSDPTYSLSTSEDITEVRVVIGGEDALFIDELRIYRNNGSGGLGSLERHHGQDDGDGWCLSTDSGDARGDWGSRVSSCVSTQAFDL